MLPNFTGEQATPAVNQASVCITRQLANMLVGCDDSIPRMKCTTPRYACSFPPRIGRVAFAETTVRSVPQVLV